MKSAKRETSCLSSSVLGVEAHSVLALYVGVQGAINLIYDAIRGLAIDLVYDLFGHLAIWPEHEVNECNRHSRG